MYRRLCIDDEYQTKMEVSEGDILGEGVGRGRFTIYWPHCTLIFVLYLRGCYESAFSLNSIYKYWCCYLMFPILSSKEIIDFLITLKKLSQ